MTLRLEGTEDDEVLVPWLTMKAHITTKTPGGNDQREGIQHNNTLRGQVPTSTQHWIEHTETPASIIHLHGLLQRIHIKRHINIAKRRIVRVVFYHQRRVIVFVWVRVGGCMYI